MEKYCFGVDLGGTAIKFGLFAENGDCLEKWETRTRREQAGEYILSDIANEIISKIKDKKLEKENCIGIGVGVPGPVTKDSVVEFCVNVGWGKTNVKQILMDLTGGLPVAIANDANIAALGEMYKGGGQGHEDLVMITLGTGVGGGVVIGGHILSGFVGAAGELGHIQVNPKEEDTCGCGNRGCLEQYASATGLVRITKKLLAEETCVSILKSKHILSAKDIFDAMKQGDTVATQAVTIMCDYLGRALATVATVLDPEIFIIGGGVSKAGRILIEQIEKTYQSVVFPVLKKKEFALAKLGNDAGIYGAAKLILQKSSNNN